MADERQKAGRTDFAKVSRQHDLADGGNAPVTSVTRGRCWCAMAATAVRHRRPLHALHGPLAEGLVVGDTIRCPWHHACFDLRTGEAVAAPALSPLACWQVEERDGKIVVGAKNEQRAPNQTGSARRTAFVIVGGGAAGFAAAEMLRRRGFAGSITMLSNDDAAPVDRPNLSKDYLAGSAPEDWVPLRGDEWYAESKIDLKLEDRGERDRSEGAAHGHARRRQQDCTFDKLLLATGAEPVRLDIPGADQQARPHAALARRLPRDHRAGEGGQARRRHRRELHRPRGRRLVARPRARGPRGRAGDGRSSACSGRSSATSSARCTKSTASSSIWRTASPRSAQPTSR